MNELLPYIIKSTLCLSLFYLAFRLVMRKETFFALNRIILLVVVVFSIIIPLLHLPQSVKPLIREQIISQIQFNEIQMQPVEIMESPISATLPDTGSEAKPLPYSTRQIFLFIYLAGMLVSLLYFLHGIISVLLMLRKAQPIKMEGYRLFILGNDIPAFSFGKMIFISRADYLDHGTTILAHEQQHIRLGHFYDLLLMETTKMIHWFNPMIYLLIQDLKAIHEYQADQQTLTKGIDATTYQLLIIEKGVGPQRLALANSFNHCQIKKRITMMNKQKTGKAGLWKVATFLPLLALLLMAFGRTGESTVENKISAETVNSLKPKLENGNNNSTQEIVYVPSNTNISPNNKKLESEKDVFNEEQINNIQQKILKGKVIDEYGNAIEGVLVYGSKTMKTKTDANGNFQLEQTEDVPIWFSLDGLRSTSRTPPEFTEHTIVKMESENLQMVVAIGYSKAKDSSTESSSSIENKDVEREDDKNNKIYSIVEQMPEFPGGTIALRKFIAEQIKYPKIAQEDKAKGQVVVNFIINREGRVWHAKVVKSAHPALDQEVIRVIYSLPSWKPGVHHGKTVNVAYTIPIDFSYKEGLN